MGLYSVKTKVKTHFWLYCFWGYRHFMIKVTIKYKVSFSSAPYFGVLFFPLFFSTGHASVFWWFIKQAYFNFRIFDLKIGDSLINLLIRFLSSRWCSLSSSSCCCVSVCGSGHTSSSSELLVSWYG